MTRGRVQLSDKQERILVQAQLMGLTPKDMQQISNRLIALKKESESKQEISEAIQGYTWIKDTKSNWCITRSDGYVIKFVKGKNLRHSYWERTRDYSVTIDKPSTAFKTRRIQKNSVILKDHPAKLCPENSKELYSLICFLNHHLDYMIRNEK